MSWRTVFIKNRAKLDLKADYLVVRNDTKTRIHLSEIYMLIIESTAVSLTAALLNELVTRKIGIVFCDEKRLPKAQVLSFYGSHDSSLKIKQQIEWLDSSKKDVWTIVVREKICNQAKLMKKFGLERYRLLETYVDELEWADASNREGHSAKVYFNELFGKGFSRNLDIAINANLNYGYSILLSAVAKEIVANGYLTQLGIFHDNRFNPYNLASDLMEPFRVLVDELVYETMPDKLEHDEKIALVNILNETVIIDGKSNYLNNAIKIYVKSVLDAISNEDIELIKVFEYDV